MSELLITPEFQQDVEEYKMIHKTVLETFLNGIIKLGEVLSRQRDKWKPQGKWHAYLKEIGLSESHAGVHIRTYEYSLKDMKTLMEVNTQNFRQLSKFLKLGDEEKASLAGVISGESLSTSDFLNKVDEIVESEILLDDVPDEPLMIESFDDSTALEIKDDDILNFSPMLNSTSTIDIPFTAKLILRALNEQDGKGFSNKTVPIIEAFLHAQQSISLIQANLSQLEPFELDFWNKNISQEVGKLQRLFNL